ncbi:MAG TPA: FCD domain-containing protein [Pusillimonas sp.]|uniref:GntR family transcriptional regulator n=1 Tax=Pusillimonas sp. TaxID=3040095 RepID=UPI002C306141|nr:FCD domain-containing protein [Pusillimonas sp.]HUH86542.1 FCD domain-containing protein [Pusillimonas sp.]
MNAALPEASRPAKASTLAEQAYVNLKRDILSGELAPGLALRLEFLKQRYQLSFTPLREALNRLNSERLVESIALKGFRVAPLSVKEMQDSMSVRTLIDCEALRRSIERATDDWETNIVAALHALDLATRRKTADDSNAGYDEVEQRHLALHRALIAACDSRWLLELSATLYIQTERYRRPMLKTSVRKESSRDVSNEHHAIVDAALNRDADQAVALLTQHYNRTTHLIEASLAQQQSA